MGASEAWSLIYKSVTLSTYKGLIFPFPIGNEFSIRATYTENSDIIRIYEIEEISGKKLDCREIQVYSPYLKKGESSNKSKLRKYLPNNSDDINIDSNKDGSRKMQEVIEEKLVKHRYDASVDIKRMKKDSIKIRTIEDENTEEMEVERDDIVATGDFGLGDRAKSLEYLPFEELARFASGELGDLIRILKTIQDDHPELNINYFIGELPAGKKGKKFATLEDGISPRKYLVATIHLAEGDIVKLLEIERQEWSLSMRELFSSNTLTNSHWTEIINDVLIALVNNNGRWCNKMLDELYDKGIYSKRINHGRKKKSLDEMAERIYKKI